MGVSVGVGVLVSDSLRLLDTFLPVEGKAVIAIETNPPSSALIDAHGVVPHGLSVGPC